MNGNANFVTLLSAIAAADMAHMHRDGVFEEIMNYVREVNPKIADQVEAAVHADQALAQPSFHVYPPEWATAILAAIKRTIDSRPPQNESPTYRAMIDGLWVENPLAAALLSIAAGDLTGQPVSLDDSLAGELDLTVSNWFRSRGATGGGLS